MADAGDNKGDQTSLEKQFASFAKFGDAKSNGKSITLSQIDKWLKQAKVIDKRLTTTDTGICFNKFKSKTITCEEFVKFIEDLAKQKNVAPDGMKEKLVACGPPGTTKTTQSVSVGGVDRLTDTSKYTGSHKERFDADGKGKGKEGRGDTGIGDGYVGNYKGKGTFDKNH